MAISFQENFIFIRKLLLSVFSYTANR